MKKLFSPFLVLAILVVVALLGNILILTDTFPLTFSDGYFEEQDEFEITLLVTPDCENCFPLAPFSDYFTENGIEESQIKEVDYNSYAGKKLVKKYSITEVPTVIIQGPVAENSFMSEMTDSIAELREGAYVVTKLQPPFYSLEEDRIVGEFKITYLDDESCEDCYDLTLHDDVLARLAMVPKSSKTLDIASEEGSNLISQYDITAVPTIIFEGEVSAYPQLTEIWSSVGTVEDDGAYILRKGVESMGPYKLIPEGEVIYPVLQDPEAVPAE